MDISEKLREYALSQGASAVAILPSEKIMIKPELAKMCQDPGCPNFGVSSSCPPHVGGPEAMRKDQEAYPQALFIRLDAPTEIILSSQSLEVKRILHEIVAGVEAKALDLGFAKASGFAGGSCKRIFCADKRDCRVVNRQEACRHPKTARPSMSGFGIDVSALAQEAGWPKLVKSADPSEQDSTMSLYGLVLLA